MKRLLCLVLLALSLHMAPASTAQAAGCDIYGGTVYRGCVYPRILWRDGYGNFFDDKISAAWSNYTQWRAAGASSQWKAVRTAPVDYKTKDYSGCGFTDQTETHFMDPTSAPSGDQLNPYSRVYVYGWKTINSSSCGQYKEYVSTITTKSIGVTIQCPRGYTAHREGDMWNREPPFGWACRPTPDLSDMQHSRPCSQCDFDLPGHSLIGNPVSLPTRHKSEFRQDLRTGGPYPIVWSRTFAGEDERDWRFEHMKFAQFTTAAGQDNLTFQRGDGSYLLFKSTGTPRNWVSDMYWGLTASLQSRAFDILDANGDLIGFELRTRAGIVETYAPNGKLVSTTNPAGHSHHYTYGFEGRLEKIEDDFGNYLEIGYKPGNNQFTQTMTLQNNPWTGTGSGSFDVTGYSGSAWAPVHLPLSATNGHASVSYQWVWESVYGYGYLLTSATDPLGNTEQYVYGETIDGSSQGKHWLTGIIDKQGRRHSTYTYTGSDVLSVRQWKHSGDGSPDDRTEGFHYQGNRLYDPNGNFTDMTHTWFQQTGGFSKPCRWCRGGIVAKTISYTSARPTTIVNFNNVSETRTYNTRKLLASRTQASGTSLARTTSLQWHPTLPLVTQVQEPIKPAGVASTRTTDITRSSTGQVDTIEVSAPGHASRQTTFSRNTAGMLEDTTHPNGRVDRLGYDSGGNVASSTQAYGTSLARTTTFGNYDASGNPGWMIDPSGLATRLQWDAASQLTKIERGIPGTGGVEGPGGTWEATLIEYSPIGKVSAIERPDGTRLEFTYNAAHRLIQVKSVGINATVLGQIDYTLTPAGDVSTSTVSVGGQTIGSTSFTYDGYSRLEKAIGAQSATHDVNLDLEGNVVGTTDPMSHATTRQVDALGRTISMVDEMLGQSTLAYDPQDNIVSATDARGVQTTYAYNAFNELVSASSPDRGTWVYSYDSAGNPVSATDPRGVVATATYDDLNRPLTLVYDDTGVTGSPAGFVAGVKNVAWDWDNCTNGMGKLCSRTDWTGVVSYSYDPWGRLAGEAFVPAGQTAALSSGYGYDAFGRLDARVYPSGKTLAFTYGNDGRVSALAWAGSTIAQNIAWQPFEGPVLGWAWGATGLPSGSSQVAFTYDQDGQMSHISDIEEIDVVHNLDGQVTALGHLTDTDLDMAYDYDARHRMVEADNALWAAPMTYGWDASSNRTNKAWDTDSWVSAYGSSSNRLVSRTPYVNGVAGTPVSPSYDAMGNVISYGGSSFGYDVAGRMVEASSGSSSADYHVNAEGLRVRKTVTGPGAIDAFAVYDDQRRRIGTYRPDGLGGFTVDEELVYLPDTWRLIATVRGQVVGGANGTAWPVLTDQIGAPRVVLDPANGDVRWTWQAKEAFGFQAPNEDPSAVGAFVFDARFPGQFVDGETGLFHNGYRDYSAQWGRYVQSDPIGLAAGWNTYEYVGGDPVGAYDPLGLIDYKIDSSHPQTRVRKCNGVICSDGRNVMIVTPRGGKAIAFIPENPDAPHRQNCHGYALDMDLWIEKPEDIYAKEFDVVSKKDADLILYRDYWFNTPMHSTKKGSPFNMGKRGIMWPAPEVNFLGLLYSWPSYWREKK